MHHIILVTNHKPLYYHMTWQFYPIIITSSVRFVPFWCGYCMLTALRCNTVDGFKQYWNTANHNWVWYHMTCLGQWNVNDFNQYRNTANHNWVWYHMTWLGQWNVSQWNLSTKAVDLLFSFVNLCFEKCLTILIHNWSLIVAIIIHFITFSFLSLKVYPIVFVVVIILYIFLETNKTRQYYLMVIGVN